MKIFLYALKVWATVVLCTVLAFTLFIWKPVPSLSVGHIFSGMSVVMLYTIPFAFFFWLTAFVYSKKDVQLYKKKVQVGLWGILFLLLTIFFLIIPSSPLKAVLITFTMLTSFVTSIWIYQLPSRKPSTITSNLKGRHILLRIQENNLLLRGIVLSELNIWPIKIKLQDNSPHSLLDLHSFQENELFTSLNYQTSVKVKVFTADRKEFLFTGTLELDHTLN
jgi:hypothetical protein